MGGALSRSSLPLISLSLPPLSPPLFPFFSLSTLFISPFSHLSSFSPLSIYLFLSNLSLANQSSSILYIPSKILLAQKFPSLKKFFFPKTLFCGSSSLPSCPPNSLGCSRGKETSAWGVDEPGRARAGGGPSVGNQRPNWVKMVQLEEGVRA